MSRIAILLFLLFAALFFLRVLRVLAETFLKGRSERGTRPSALEGGMVRDPVCGTWIDRRLALAVQSGGQWVPVCSEKCRARLLGT